MAQIGQNEPLGISKRCNGLHESHPVFGKIFEDSFRSSHSNCSPKVIAGRPTGSHRGHIPREPRFLLVPLGFVGAFAH